MRVKELVKVLQAEMDKQDISKIHTHAELHDLVFKVASPICAETCLKVQVWRIAFDYGCEIIDYVAEFKKYAYCKYADKGNFSSVKFVARHEVVNLELVDLEEFFKVKAYNNEITNYTEYIADLEAKLEENKKHLAKLLAQKATYRRER
jgi:hypothetical protein